MVLQILKIFIDKSILNFREYIFLRKKNGEIVQNGNSKDMLFHFDKIISYISKFYTLKIGDLIYTGTPEGVSKFKRRYFKRIYRTKRNVKGISKVVI